MDGIEKKLFFTVEPAGLNGISFKMLYKTSTPRKRISSMDRCIMQKCPQSSKKPQYKPAKTRTADHIFFWKGVFSPSTFSLNKLHTRML